MELLVTAHSPDWPSSRVHAESAHRLLAFEYSASPGQYWLPTPHQPPPEQQRAGLHVACWKRGPQRWPTVSSEG